MTTTAPTGAPSGDGPAAKKPYNPTPEKTGAAAGGAASNVAEKKKNFSLNDIPTPVIMIGVLLVRFSFLNLVSNFLFSLNYA